MENHQKSFWEQVISSDANLAFLMVNVCGILWYAVITKQALPDGMVMLVLGIFGGKTVYGVVAAKNGNGSVNGNGNGSSAFRGLKKP